MKLIRLNTIPDFEALKKGDFVVCEFKNNGKKNVRGFNVVENRLDDSEIILQKRGNIYFNYNKYLKGKSIIKSIILIKEG